MRSSATSPGESPDPAAPSLRQVIPVALVLALGLALSVGIFLLVRRSDRERVAREFAWRAQSAADDLSETVLRSEDCLYSLRDLFDSSEDVTAVEFKRATDNLRERHPGIQSLAYIAATDAGAWQLTYIEPVRGNEAVLGTDQALGPHRAVLSAAAAAGQVRGTKRVPLREPTNTQFGWETVLPLYRPGPPPQTGEERRTRLRGFIGGAFRLTDLVNSMTHEHSGRTVETLLKDESPGVADPFLIAQVGGTIRTAAPPLIRDFQTGLNLAIPVTVSDRQWRIYFRPSPAWLASQSTSYAAAFLGTGVALTALLTSILLNAQRRRATVEKLVNQRTAELREVQERLRADIRERDAAERALRASEERYRAFVEQCTEAIWRFEIEPPIPTDLPVEEQIGRYFHDAQLAECNDVMAQMYGFVRAKEFVGTRLAELLPPAEPRNAAHIRAFIENRYRLTDEETLECDKDGRPKSFLNNLTGIVEDGLLKRTWGTQRDITERKRAQEERALFERKLQETQKLESLGVLAGGIAHDFNNLLTGVLGNASLARSELPAESPAQESLAQIETVAQRAAELCKQMLAYSGKGHFIVRRLDLSAVVRDTTDLIQLSISKRAGLKFALAPDLPAITADATQVRQIVMNLVINASEAIGEKDGVIVISTGLMHADRTYLTETYLAPGIPEGRYAFLEVSDNGSGMSAETRDRVFDPFFTTKFAGRGLGLAAVLGIVRGHRGAMKVYSEPGRGTTFKLLLPCADGPADAVPAPAAPAGAWRGSGIVLVIDDEETVRTVSARMLRLAGFEPLLATNGREGAELFASRAGEIAGVLLDLTMPVLDGAATLTELRRIRADVRVLLMSGFTEHDALDRFAGKGLSGFLQKPFKSDELRAALRAMFAPDKT